jgi:hypothetical protein
MSRHQSYHDISNRMFFIKFFVMLHSNGTGLCSSIGLSAAPKSQGRGLDSCQRAYIVCIFRIDVQNLHSKFPSAKSFNVGDLPTCFSAVVPYKMITVFDLLNRV